MILQSAYVHAFCNVILYIVYKMFVFVHDADSELLTRTLSLDVIELLQTNSRFYLMLIYRRNAYLDRYECSHPDTRKTQKMVKCAWLKAKFLSSLFCFSWMALISIRLLSCKFLHTRRFRVIMSAIAIKMNSMKCYLFSMHKYSNWIIHHIKT